MIKISCNCDECTKCLDDGDIIYCSSCFAELRREIEELEKENYKLKEVVDER